MSDDPNKPIHVTIKTQDQALAYNVVYIMQRFSHVAVLHDYEAPNDVISSTLTQECAKACGYAMHSAYGKKVKISMKPSTNSAFPESRNVHSYD